MRGAVGYDAPGDGQRDAKRAVQLVRRGSIQVDLPAALEGHHLVLEWHVHALAVRERRGEIDTREVRAGEYPAGNLDEVGDMRASLQRVSAGRAHRAQHRRLESRGEIYPRSR